MNTLDCLGSRFDAIVVGASAGGTEALTKLLPRLPSGLRASVFVVMHLPREHPSLLPMMYSPQCAVRVAEALDKEPVAPGTVYFAPPNYHLLIERGPSLALSVDDAVRFSRPSIDVLFESAAEVYADRLLGVILSGANDDGARGLQAVLSAGGSAMVQNPSEAKASTMPLEALRRCPQAQTLTTQRIAELFSTLATGEAA
jgi:two-component system, chemotaxis family, protein-glutamate methylesterase/glutaminase